MSKSKDIECKREREKLYKLSHMYLYIHVVSDCKKKLQT